MTGLLSIRNVTAGYGYGPDIVHDFSLSLNESEVKCIIGPNGAGKSTLLKAVAGILKPRSGDIFFEGENISGKEAYQIMRLGICFLPQERAIFPNLTVEENLRMCAYSIKDKALAKARIEAAIGMFPVLGQRLKQIAGTMSGGQQQQLVYARAFTIKPKIILIDEPSLGLAPSLVEQTFNHIKQIAASGIAVMLVEQNAIKGLQTSGYGVVMDLGKLVFEKPANEVLQDQSLRDLYLGKALKK
jgi:branched-chain amino acid transport system ATP-binding protein